MPQKGQITNSNELFYLRKQGAYYAYESRGYVYEFINAGIYTKEKAELCCSKCLDISMELIDIDRHNKAIDDRIKDLLKLKICKV